jgi:hypothetical protein
MADYQAARVTEEEKTARGPRDLPERLSGANAANRRQPLVKGTTGCCRPNCRQRKRGGRVAGGTRGCNRLHAGMSCGRSCRS